MKAMVRFVDGRSTVEGKAVAAVLSALLLFSAFTPTALAVADEAVEQDVFEVSDIPAIDDEPANEETLPSAGYIPSDFVRIAIEADHATVIGPDGTVIEAASVAAGDDFSFTVEPEEGYEVQLVTYQDEALDPAITRRTVSEAGASSEDEDAESVYVIEAEKLVDGESLKVVAEAASNEDEQEGADESGLATDSAAEQGEQDEDAAAVESSSGTVAQPSQNMAAALQNAIVESVMNVADESVRAVSAPVRTAETGDEVLALSVGLYRGGSYMAPSSISLPSNGTAVSVDQVFPVASPTFKIDNVTYVLNGKVGIVSGDVQADQSEVWQGCEEASQCVGMLRVQGDVIEYQRVGSADWQALGEDESLAYFCAKLQNSGDDRDVVNIAVDEDCIDDFVEGCHGIKLYVFDATSSDAESALLAEKELFFSPSLTRLAQGIRFDLGDGVKYEAQEAYLTSSTQVPFQADVAWRLRGDESIRYASGQAIDFSADSEAIYRTMAVFVSPRSYSVSYDLCGGEGAVPASASYASGDAVLVSSQDPTKEGMDFVAWAAIDSSGEELCRVQAGGTFSMPSSNITLKAIWDEAAEGKYYDARYVWKDAEGVEHELTTVRVKVDAEGNALTNGASVAANADECPAGYDCSSAATATFSHVGQVVSFYCTKKTYTVETRYYYDNTLGGKTVAEGVDFGTSIVTNPPLATTYNIGGTNAVEKTYALEKVVNGVMTVSAIEGENIIGVYYATDLMGVEDPAQPDGVPDKYQAKVTFSHDDVETGQTTSQTIVVTLYDKNGNMATANQGGTATLTKEQIPSLDVPEGYTVDYESSNWSEAGAVVKGDANFKVVYKKASFPYTVLAVDENGAILDSIEGVGEYGDYIPYEVADLEGYALDQVDNGNAIIGVDESQNVVALRYAVDVLGGVGSVLGDGVPDKYQAAVTYRAVNGAFDTLPVSGEVQVAVSLKEPVNGVWTDVAADRLDRRIPATATPNEGYVAGSWGENDPQTADFQMGGSYEFTYTFQKGQFGYTVNYYRDSIAEENLIGEAVSGTALFEEAIPWTDTKCPAGYVKEATVSGQATVTANAENNVLNVVFPRAYFTIQGAIYSHGTIEGNPRQTLAYGNSSERMVFKADEGYRIASITINGVSEEVAPGITSYEFASIRRVTENVEIEVRTVRMESIAIVAPSASQVYNGTVLEAAPAQISGVPEGFTAKAEVVGAQTNAGSSAATVDRDSIEIRDAAGKDVTKNFVIEVIDGTLNVDRAQATVTVADADKTAGTQDPEFSGTVEGLVDGEMLQNMSYVRTVEGEMAGVYVDALSVRYDYDGNYDVTVVPGTFTINAVMPSVVPSSGVTREPLTPNGGEAAASTQTASRSVSTLTTLSAARELLEAARPASMDDLAEPVYADVIGDDETPMVSRRGAETIEDDPNALGAFDEPHCWVHWVMAFGILLTVAYAGAVVLRRLGYARRAGRLDDDLTGGAVAEDKVADRAIQHLSA